MNKKYYRDDLKKSETINTALETSMKLEEVLNDLSCWLVTYLIDYDSNYKKLWKLN